MVGKSKRQLENRYERRRRALVRKIKGDTAIFVSAPITNLSLDQDHLFRQNSDLFYLSGFTEPESILVLRGASKGPRSVLFLRDRNPAQERWTGERLGIARAKRRFAIDEIRDIENLTAELPELLHKCRTLHYAPGIHPNMDRFIFSLLQTPLGPRKDSPHTLKDSRLLTSEMRAIKDSHEIQTIQHAVDISVRSFINLYRNIGQARSESHAAKLLEAEFARYGTSQSAFPTIVASGKNATVLHHHPQQHPLWQRELILIDAGASFQGYCADITRTIPRSGTFSTPQAEVYDIVAGALKQAIKRAKPGTTLNAIHKTTVRAITRGLIDLNILEGDLNERIRDKSYTRYFMHGTSHWLGLDVHDISPLHENASGELVESKKHQLVPGNVFTIEPGLYFDPKDKDIPKQYRGIGIRLEEDVAITTTSCKVLSKDLPIDREEVEALFT